MANAKTHKQFVAEVKEQVGKEYKVIGKYVNTHTKLEMKHNTCGHVYLVTPNGFLSRKNRCPECNKQRLSNHLSQLAYNSRKSHDQFVAEVKEQVGDEYTVLSNYRTTHSKIDIRHNTCGYEYQVTPNGFLSRKNRCPKCARKLLSERMKNSKPVLSVNKEEINNIPTLINNYLKENNIEDINTISISLS